MAEPAVALIDLHKRYGGTVAVGGIDLEVRPGEFLTLLGPSGCGKTTTLGMIAGFVEPDRGSIRLGGRPVERLPPFKRDIGVVFQDYALFPHMDVAANVGFGLRMRGIGRAEIGRRVAEALELVQLGPLGGRRPAALSGGQRQRVALARALVIRPAVLLLDEPLSNLDLKLREEMRLEISAVQRRTGITTILVTHDQGEALAVSDRIAVMRAGRIEQVGRPGDIYEHPATRFVAEFIGTMNVCPGTALVDVARGGVCSVQTAHGVVAAMAPGGAVGGHAVIVAVRPERLRLGGDAGAGGLSLAGVIEQFVYLGAKTELRVRAGSGELFVLEQANDGREAGHETGGAGRADGAGGRPADVRCCARDGSGAFGDRVVQFDHDAVGVAEEELGLAVAGDDAFLEADAAGGEALLHGDEAGAGKGDVVEEAGGRRLAGGLAGFGRTDADQVHGRLPAGVEPVAGEVEGRAVADLEAEEVDVEGAGGLEVGGADGVVVQAFEGHGVLLIR